MDVFRVKGEQKSCVIKSQVLKYNFGNSESRQEGKKERKNGGREEGDENKMIKKSFQIFFFPS